MILPSVWHGWAFPARRSQTGGYPLPAASPQPKRWFPWRHVGSPLPAGTLEWPFGLQSVPEVHKERCNHIIQQLQGCYLKCKLICFQVINIMPVELRVLCGASTCVTDVTSFPLTSSGCSSCACAAFSVCLFVTSMIDVFLKEPRLISYDRHRGRHLALHTFMHIQAQKNKHALM